MSFGGPPCLKLAPFVCRTSAGCIDCIAPFGREDRRAQLPRDFAQVRHVLGGHVRVDAVLVEQVDAVRRRRSDASAPLIFQPDAKSFVTHKDEAQADQEERGCSE